MLALLLFLLQFVSVSLVARIVVVSVAGGLVTSVVVTIIIIVAVVVVAIVIVIIIFIIINATSTLDILELLYCMLCVSKYDHLYICIVYIVEYISYMNICRFIVILHMYIYIYI